MDDASFIQAVNKAPHAPDVRKSYTDWLRGLGDVRGDFLLAEDELFGLNGNEAGYADALARWLQLRDRMPMDWLDGLGWRVNGLLMPQSLLDVLGSGRWDNQEFVLSGGLECAYAYSLRLMRSETAGVFGLGWLGTADSKHSPGDIDRNLTVMIADQGMGSDSPFALDYRSSFAQPRVVLYRWRLAADPSKTAWSERDNRWVEVASSFGEFWTKFEGHSM